MEDFRNSPEFMQAVQSAVAQTMRDMPDPWHSGRGDPWTSQEPTAHSYPTMQEPSVHDSDEEEERLPPDFDDIWPQQQDDSQRPEEESAPRGQSSKWRGTRNYPNSSNSGSQREFTHDGPKRVIHDQPPTWDGKDADNKLQPFLKLLQAWLVTTRTLKGQQGITILNYATHDLQVLINELPIETLTSETSGQIVYDHIKENYAEFLEKKLPKLIERALYQPECRRNRSESMIQYVTRKKVLLAELERGSCVLPPVF